MTIIVEPATTSATRDHLVLDGLNLNATTAAGPHLELDSLTFTPARKRIQFIQGADSDGSISASEAHYDNGQMVATVRAVDCVTLAEALGVLAQVTQRLEDAEIIRGGLPLVWTPAADPFSLRVVSGQMDEVQVTPEAGWTSDSPTRQLTLVLAPFAVGAEVTGPQVTASAPILTAEIPNVPGDVAALGRLGLLDAATQARRHAEWGLEHHHYNAATSVLVDSDSLITSGYAGAQATRTGAHDPDAVGNNVVRVTAQREPQAACGIPNLSHEGVYRVKARIHSTFADDRVRLVWQAGGSPLQAMDWQSPPALNDFSEPELGIIDVPPGGWSGRIEVKSTTSKVIDVDYLSLIPAGDGYGRATATYSYAAGVQNARDEFTATTAGGALNGRIAPTGGTWATLGATGDFLFADGPGSGEETVQRSTASEGPRRLATLPTAYTATEVSVRVRLPSPYDPDATTGGVGDPGLVAIPPKGGVVARFVDSLNYLTAFVAYNELRVEHEVAGSTTTLYATSLSVPYEVWVTLRLTVQPTGRWSMALLDANGAVLHTKEGFAAPLATGGALASGKPGFMDHNPGTLATARYYDVFSHTLPAPESLVIAASRSMEFRHDETVTQDTSGREGVIHHRGSIFTVPTGTSRVVAKARRFDPAVAADAPVTDATTMSVFYKPRFIDPR